MLLAGTEVDEEHGGGAKQNSRPLCSNTRHWETHSDTFTYSHTGTVYRAHRHMLLPTTTQTFSSISQDRPISSPVLGVEAEGPSL